MALGGTQAKARASEEFPGSPAGQSRRVREAASPVREVPLSAVHERSKPLCVEHRSLAQGLDRGRRLDALEWLVQAFDAMSLPDVHLFSAVGLLDRFAASSPAPIAAGPGAFALVLAAMLVALKVSGTQKELERAKRLVVDVSGTSRPWEGVRRAEMGILRRLNFVTASPTSRDLLERLLGELRSSCSPSEGSTGAWDADARSKASDIARFLLELGMVHDPEAIYGPGRPPLAAALAALLLALNAVGAPKQCAQALTEPLRLLDPTCAAAIAEIAEAMRQRWQHEERRASEQRGGDRSGSAVLEKWTKRVGSFEVSPPPPGLGDFRLLVGPASESAQQQEATSRQSTKVCGRRPGSPRNPSVLAALPTPARRAAREVTAGQTSAASTSQAPALGSSQRAAAPAPAKDAGDPSQPLPPPRPAAPAPGAKLTCPGVLPRATAADSLPSWPAGQQDAEADAARVDMAQVLGMTRRDASGASTELLLTSALRLVWPERKGSDASSDRLDVAAAAAAAREAAAKLQLAAQQLAGAAEALEKGVAAAPRDSKAPPAAEPSKRRRTFGGASPNRPPSPPREARAGSPHPSARFTGLRV